MKTNIKKSLALIVFLSSFTFMLMNASKASPTLKSSVFERSSVDVFQVNDEQVRLLKAEKARYYFLLNNLKEEHQRNINNIVVNFMIEK